MQNDEFTVNYELWNNFLKHNQIGDLYACIPFQKSTQSEIIRNKLNEFYKKNCGVAVLYGETGTGKTYASLRLCLGKMQGITIRFYKSDRLSDEWSNRTHDNSLHQLKYNVYDCDILIIDDFGQMIPKDNYMSFIFNLLDHRIEHTKKITIITTNLTFPKLVEIFGEALMDRLKKQTWIHFAGNSKR
jgi:DNA replication protein DnaC